MSRFQMNTYQSEGLLLLLTGLIADRAAGLACGLAGCLAFAATALLHALLKRSGIQSLDVLHI